MKTTAVITNSRKTFIDWCKTRKIKRTSSNMFIDSEGDRYIPVSNKYDILGFIFNDFEIIDRIHIPNEEEILEAVKSRIR